MTSKISHMDPRDPYDFLVNNTTFPANNSLCFSKIFTKSYIII